MSYLDLPRIHFSGRFFTDPSTMNNDPVHYAPEVDKPAPWQMPKGMHYFRFFDCTVKSAMGLDGQVVTDPGLIGADVHSIDKPVPAKIVDLDVYQQAVTQLFGLQLSISAGDTGGLTAAMRTPVLNGAWFKAVLPTRGWEEAYGSAGSYGEDSSALGTFQTVLEVKETDWTFPRTGLMEEMRRRCSQTTTPDGEAVYLLSFKFVLDGYWNIPGETLYQTGRVVATIGPLLEHDPHETPGGRWLEPRPVDPAAPWFVPRFYRMPFRVDQTKQRLQIDWSGSVPRQSFGGDPVDLGQIEALVVTPDGPVSLGSFVIDARHHTMSSGLTEIPLKPRDVERLATNPLVLRTSRDDLGPPQIFAEASDGVSVATQMRSIRMTSDLGRDTTRAQATVVVRKFGEPWADQQLNLQIVPVHGSTPGATVPPTNPGDTPKAEGALVGQVTRTNAHGVATIHFEAVHDPGSRTPQLDGQMYFAYAYFGDTSPAKTVVQEQQVSVLVWSRYPVAENPEWAQIYELMEPYAKLFPGMKEKFNVADETAFVFYSNNPAGAFFVGPKGKFDIPGHPEIQDGAIPYYLSLPIEDPRFMPVTRDLSPPKIETILNFIANEQAKIKAQMKKDDEEGIDDAWCADHDTGTKEGQ